MMKTTRALQLLGLAFLATTFHACADDGDGSTSSAPIATTPLAGKVGGAAWTFETGATNAFLSADDDDYFATLFAVDFSGCEDAPQGGVTAVILSIPKTVGTRSFGLQLNGTFVVQGADGPENLATINGKITVDAITDTTITGGVRMTYDAANTIDGRFEVMICP